MEETKRKTYMEIGSGRLLDIVVYLDDNLEYEGMVEDAPDYIKALRYSDIQAKNGQIIYKTYSDYQKEGVN